VRYRDLACDAGRSSRAESPQYTTGASVIYVESPPPAAYSRP